jgi:nucleoside-diphosphate-sugar epimerase
MRVALTGGTGFVGSHCLVRLLADGHSVHMLVRDPDKVRRALSMHGVTPPDASDADVAALGVSFAVAELTDADQVRTALDGCDGVIHAAALLATGPKNETTMRAFNPASADTIFTTARDLGIDPIVYLSTMGCFADARPGDTIDAHRDPGQGCGGYTASKADAERVARRHQAEGAPVVCVYPGVITGPVDPNPAFSESTRAIKNLVERKSPALPLAAAMPFADVREVAEVCVRSLERGRGPRRYIMGTEWHPLREVVDVVRDVTGRSIRVASLPTGVIEPAARVVDLLMRTTPLELPATGEDLRMMLSGVGGEPILDQRPLKEDFDLPRTPFADSIADTVRWMAGAGVISARHAGLAAG